MSIQVAPASSPSISSVAASVTSVGPGSIVIRTSAACAACAADAAPGQAGSLGGRSQLAAEIAPRDLKSGRGQPRGHRQAHLSQPDEADPGTAGGGGRRLAH